MPTHLPLDKALEFLDGKGGDEVFVAEKRPDDLQSISVCQVKELVVILSGGGL